jgi:hypothetical protein
VAPSRGESAKPCHEGIGYRSAFPYRNALRARREALPAVLVSELADESDESTKSPRQAEVVAVVPRLDDSAVSYADDEESSPGYSCCEHR